MKQIGVRAAIAAGVLVAGGVLASLVLGGPTALIGGTGNPQDGAGKPAAAGKASGRGTHSGKTAGVKSGSAEEDSVTNPRDGLPLVTASPLKGIQYAAAPAEAKAFFAPVTNASGGLVVSSKVSAVKIDGRAVGMVGVYSVKPGLSKSDMFQDQYVVQLIQAVTKSSSSPRFVRMNGRVVALSTGRVPVVGWFEADRAVLIHRQAAKPDLEDLAFSVIRQPKGR